MIKQAIYAYLAAQTDITDITSTRIYPTLRPPRAGFPTDSIAFDRTGKGKDYTHDGASGLITETFQFSCFSSSDLQAENIADELETSLESMIGTYSTLKVSKCFLDSQTDVYADNSQIFQVVQTWTIQYRR